MWGLPRSYLYDEDYTVEVKNRVVTTSALRYRTLWAVVSVYLYRSNDTTKATKGVTILDRDVVLSSFELIGNDAVMKSLFAAMCSCLEPAQACVLLDMSFEQEHRKRWVLIGKISHDMKQSCLPCHDELLRDLMRAMDNLPSSRRRSCGSCLDHLSRHTPDHRRYEITEFFLSTRWRPIRDRDKHLLGNWSKCWVAQVDNNWRMWADPGAIRLLIQYFPESYLLDQFDDILRVVGNTYLARKLYLRVVPFDLGKLERLRREDPVTYAYILVKLNKKLDDCEALHIFTQSRGNQDVGLLLWCYGRMGLWSVLNKIYGELSDGKRYLWYRESITELMSES